MTQEIESIKPILTVIDDEGDLILNSTGPRGKAMIQAVLALANDVRKISVISDGEMKVMKRSGNGQAPQTAAEPVAATPPTRRPVSPTQPNGPDIQDSFVFDLEAGVTGEIATGEAPKPPARRKPVIYQDAAAPPAPELVEQEMARLLEEAAQGERDAAKAQEDQRFQRQQAVQAGEEPVEVEPAANKPRKREPRNLAVSGQACGNCGGSGQSIRVDSTGSTIPDAQGQPLAGVCQVCSGSGHVMAWGRGRSSRVR